MANHSDHYNVTHGTGHTPGTERLTVASPSDSSGSLAGFAIGALVVILVAFGVFAFFGNSESTAPAPAAIETTVEPPAAGTVAPEAGTPEAAGSVAPEAAAPETAAPAADPAAPAEAQ